MKKFLVAVALMCVISSSPLMADENERLRCECTDQCECNDSVNHYHYHHRRGFTFRYHSPRDIFGGIGSYAVGVTARVGRGACEIVAAPFTTVPVMAPPRTYVYYPSRIDYTPPAVRRIYPRRFHWHWD